jgi:hypothetical protein
MTVPEPIWIEYAVDFLLFALGFTTGVFFCLALCRR